MNEMEWLRWILLAAGGLLLIAIYLVGRRRLSGGRRGDTHLSPEEQQEADELAGLSALVRDHDADALRHDAAAQADEFSDPREPRMNLTHGDRDSDQDAGPPARAQTHPTASDRGHQEPMPAVTEPPLLRHRISGVGLPYGGRAARRETELPPPPREQPRATPAELAVPQTARPYAQPAPAPMADEKIVVLYILAPENRPFTGPAVVRAVEGADLIFGRKKVYHRVAPGDPKQQTVYGLANMVEPGWFEMARINELRTPGLSLFLSLPGPLDGVSAWDDMLRTSRRIAAELGGRLCDADRAALTEHKAMRIRDEVIVHQRSSRLARQHP